MPTDTLNTDIASFAASSCLRAVVRGGSADGGRKTCVGTGAARLTEVKQVVNSCLGVLERAAVGLGQVGVGGGSGGGDDIESETRARARVRFEGELLAVNDLL